MLKTTELRHIEASAAFAIQNRAVLKKEKCSDSTVILKRINLKNQMQQKRKILVTPMDLQNADCETVPNITGSWCGHVGGI